MNEFVPKFIHVDITGKCNFACRHCRGMQSNNDLPLIKIKKIFDRIFSLWGSEIEWVEIGGGEPLLHKELIEIVQFIKKSCRAKVLIVSNASLFSEEIGKKLLEVGLDRIQFSLDGATEKSHNWLRNNTASFGQVISATKICNMLKLPFVLRMTLNQKNKKEIEAYFKLAKELGASEVGIRGCLYVGSALPNEKDLFIDPKEYAKILKDLPKLRKKFSLPYFSGDPLALVANDELIDKIFAKYGTLNIYSGCCVGISYLYINNDGKISFCPMLNDIVLGDPLREDIKKIWENNPNFINNRMRNVSGKCSRCKYLRLCGSCSAYGYWKSGKLFQENPICTFFTENIRRNKNGN